jgi:error-prone DNA polymerase
MYSELHCKTNYSFLTGGSHADELVARAVELGYPALAITDVNTLAGVVRAYSAVKELPQLASQLSTVNPKTPTRKSKISDPESQFSELASQTDNREPKTEISSFKLIIGAEIIPRDAPPVLLWATDRNSYANLSKLITIGRRRAPKGECWLEFDDIARYSAGLLAGVLPSFQGDRSRLSAIDETHPSYEWFFGCEKGNLSLTSLLVSSPSQTSHHHHTLDHKHGPDHSHGHHGPKQGVYPHLGIHDPRKSNLQTAHHYRELFGDRAYLMASLYLGIDDQWRIAQLKKLSAETGLPLVAAGDVLYHHPSRLPLHDVLTAIKHRTTVASAEELLLPNAQRHLQSIARRQAAFASVPGAVERTVEISDRCQFCLSQLRYEYPEELAPSGQTPIQHLRRLTERGAQQRYPDGVPAKVRQQVEHEMLLIDELRYEAYFLTVWDLVRFARSRGILCQGRGSAANSAVCYCLGVTSVDPATSDLLFERFISRERNEAPDIDVDFEHERREEVLQYLYEKYGRHRAGLAATVITYRTRSAVRDVGKAIGLSLDRVDALAKQVDGYARDANLAVRMNAVGIDPESTVGKQLLHLVDEILGFPRHLSQHVGGMVITQGNLDELVPIENAAMDGRTVIQWDKDDLESLGLLKVDCLCLGMLSAIRRCFQMIQQHWGQSYTLTNIPAEDPKVYDMICAADTVGVFQIESRGQMSMLPRLKPRCWYDLVIEVAIVRPGPIQGNMVHPYLRRRSGAEPTFYPNEEIKAVLHRTLGVPIFQEQAMKLAVVAAGFTPGEADQLRRAMGKWRKTGIIQKFHDQLIAGMRAKGLNEEFAEQVFRQISGFGEYGFPESHAASFAKLVYVSAWLKYYFPGPFCAAIINSQPMGFYAPAQLVADAQRHGVEVLPVDVNESDWECTVNAIAIPPSPPRERGVGGKGDNIQQNDESSNQRERKKQGFQNPYPSRLRLGLRMIAGLRTDVAEKVLAARQQGRFTSIAEFTRRTGLSQSEIAQLSAADAFGSLNQDRREALWQALAQEKKPRDQPLFANLNEGDDAVGALPKLDAIEQVTADYHTLGLSLKAHPMSFYRDQLNALQATPCAQLEDRKDNQYVRVAGLVILRQRPSTAKGITFVTLEDETGTANLVVKPNVWEKHYQIARRSAAWLVHGKLEKRSGVIHVVASRIEDLSDQVQNVKIRNRDFR